MGFPRTSYDLDDTDFNVGKAFLGFLAVVGGLAFTFAVIAYATWANAVVLSNLWQWFVAPVFTDVPEQLTLLQAAGLGLIVSFLTKHTTHTENEKETKTAKWTRFISAALSPWITLLIGYIIHSL